MNNRRSPVKALREPTDIEIKAANTVKIAFQKVFDPKDGNAEIVLNYLREYCGVDKQSFVPDSATMTAFNEGQRNVFLHIQEVKNRDVKKYLFNKLNKTMS